MSLEAIKPEALIAVCIAIGGAVWKVISMLFGLHRRIEITEKELASLKVEVAVQYQAVRQDIKESSVETRQRYAHIEEKLDRLIERGMGRCE